MATLRANKESKIVQIMHFDFLDFSGSLSVTVNL